MNRKLRPCGIAEIMANAGCLNSRLTARPAASQNRQDNTHTHPMNVKKKLESCETPSASEHQVASGRYSCNTCAYVTNDFMNYITHKNGHADNNVQEISLFTCGMCDFSTPTPECMVHHIKCHLKPLPDLPQQAKDTAIWRDNIADKRPIEMSANEKNVTYNGQESHMAISDKVNRILEYVGTTHLPNIGSQSVPTHFQQICENEHLNANVQNQIPDITSRVAKCSLGEPSSLTTPEVINHSNASQSCLTVQEKSPVLQPSFNRSAGNLESTVRKSKKKQIVTPHASSNLPQNPTSDHLNFSAKSCKVPNQNKKLDLLTSADLRENERSDPSDQPFCSISEVKSLSLITSENESTKESQLQEFKLTSASVVDKLNDENGAHPPTNNFNQQRNAVRVNDKALCLNISDHHAVISNPHSVVESQKAEQKSSTKDNQMTSSFVLCQTLKKESDCLDKYARSKSGMSGDDGSWKKDKVLETYPSPEYGAGRQGLTPVAGTSKASFKKKNANSSPKGSKKSSKKPQVKKLKTSKKSVNLQKTLQHPFTQTGSSSSATFRRPQTAPVKRSAEEEIQKAQDELIDYLQLRRVIPAHPIEPVMREKVSISCENPPIDPECSQSQPTEMEQECQDGSLVYIYRYNEPVCIKYHSDRDSKVTTSRGVKAIKPANACLQVSTPITRASSPAIGSQNLALSVSTPASTKSSMRTPENAPNSSPTHKRGVLKRLLPDLQQLENSCSSPTKSRKVGVSQETLNSSANEQENILLQSKSNMPSNKQVAAATENSQAPLQLPNAFSATEGLLNSEPQLYHGHGCQENFPVTGVHNRADKATADGVTDVSSNQGVVHRDSEPNDIDFPVDLGEKFILKQCKVVLTRYDHDDQLSLASPMSLASKLRSSLQNSWKKIKINRQDTDYQNSKCTNSQDTETIPRISKTQALWAIRDLEEF